MVYFDGGLCIVFKCDFVMMYDVMVSDMGVWMWICVL